MDMRRRRSSSSVTLVLISASALTACGQSPQSTLGGDTLRRDIYTSQADCAKDWGADPTKCEPRKVGSGNSSYTHYYGPSYHPGAYGSTHSAHSAGSTTEARPGTRAIGTAHVARGGLGSSASAHGSSSGAHGSSGS